MLSQQTSLKVLIHDQYCKWSKVQISNTSRQSNEVFTKEYSCSIQSIAPHGDHQSLEGIYVHEAVRLIYFH